MTEWIETEGPLAGGKISQRVFETSILPRLGARRSEVLVGPLHGVDAGIIALDAEHVMALTTDPLFVMPECGWRRATWFAVHIVASDLATSGLAPQYCTIDLNLPPTCSDKCLDNLWEGIHLACLEIGVAVITGHTGRYDGADFPIVGGATMIGQGPAGGYVTPAMANPGDRVLLTKGAAIETTAMFGALLGHRLQDSLGAETARAADALFESMSVVEDARVAASVGLRGDGVTTMHDATERGVWGALHELASASGVGLLIDQDAILVRPETLLVCDLFGIDPFTCSSEGTLLLTCGPTREGEVMRRLRDSGIAVCSIGEVRPVSAGVRSIKAGTEQVAPLPTHDPFWPALIEALGE